MFVKICGITNREDALAAVEAGARALGFIFYARSPRYVTAAQLEPWISEIPADVWKVGVFVDEAPETIGQIANQIGLDVAQLHGAETPEQSPRGIRVWKAFRVKESTPIGDYPAEAILLDGPATGVAFDWTLATSVAKPVILAGGLNAENVREAIDKARPWGVDVSSGVEASPGRKDHARMKKFIEAVFNS